MTVELMVSIAGIFVNLIGLLLGLMISVSRIQAASAAQMTTLEVRSAERFGKLETMAKRSESDIQNLFNLHRKEF